MSEDLHRALADLTRGAPGRVTRALPGELTAAGRRLVFAARSLAPIETGAYAEQYQAQPLDGGLAVGSSVPYAEYVEARHSVTERALDAEEDAILDLFADGLLDAYAKPGGS